jgi:hypothetical protein
MLRMPRLAIRKRLRNGMEKKGEVRRGEERRGGGKEKSCVTHC